MEMNEGLNCNKLQVGKEICVSVESNDVKNSQTVDDQKPSLPMVESEFHHIKILIKVVYEKRFSDGIVWWVHHN